MLYMFDVRLAMFEPEHGPDGMDEEALTVWQCQQAYL